MKAAKTLDKNQYIKRLAKIFSFGNVYLLLILKFSANAVSTFYYTNEDSNSKNIL